MGRGVSQRTRDLLQVAREILERIRPASVRAVCYQLFSRGLIPSMGKQDTDRVSRILTGAREERVIPHDWIIQEGRPIERAPTWEDPEEFARVVQEAYSRDKWVAQPCTVIVVSEKGTVRGTLQPVLEDYAVGFAPVASASTTRVHDVAMLPEPGKRLVVLYLGDFDPSGMSMNEKDLPRRLACYVDSPGAPDRRTVRSWNRARVAGFLAEAGIEFRRLALVQADTRRIGRRLSFPASDKGPQPDSKGDSNDPWFVEHYGDRCWELDAMTRWPCGRRSRPPSRRRSSRWPGRGTPRPSSSNESRSGPTAGRSPVFPG